MKDVVKKEMTGALIWAAVVLALALGASFAHRFGYIDRDTVTRLLSGVMGLWIAWAGNRIPKIFTRSAPARRIQRVAAWSQVLSGLVYAGLWAFAPIPLAVSGGTVAVMAGIAVTFGYCLSRRAQARAS